jgi:hypothetical protein
LMVPASGITIHVRACLGKRVGCLSTPMLSILGRPSQFNDFVATLRHAAA